MKIVISDANILIDLLKLEILDGFFRIPYEIITTDIIVETELNKIQRERIFEAEEENKLKVEKSTAEEIKSITDIFNETPGISLPDSGVYYIAKNKNAILLSGDKKLRSFAKSKGVQVHGIIWVFDQLKECAIYTQNSLATKLNELMEINNRLPKDECISRIERWLS